MARYALVVGVGENIPPLRSLSKTVGDATAIADVFEQSGNFASVDRLIGKVNQHELAAALQKLLRLQAKGNEAVIYYTGHGFPLVGSFGRERAYLAPSDCRITVEHGQVIGQDRGILLEDFNGLTREAQLNRLVVLLECCYSGALLESEKLREAITAFTTTDYFLIAACRDFEKAYALKSANHSIFTTALLKALRQEKNDRGEVTTGSVFDSIYNDLHGSGQEPFFLGGGRSIALLNYPIEAATGEFIDETCPYQGLLPFTPETEQFFFGREAEMTKLLEQLQIAQFVPVIGASGSGKSSIVRAGLLPRLERQGWRTLEPMKPGEMPIAQLKLTIASCFDAQDREAIYSLLDSQGLAAVMTQLPMDDKVLLVVDQFEEVFTVCTNKSERDRFIELITTANSPNLAIVTTMRADFVEPWLSYGKLTEAIQHDAVWLGTLSEGALTAAIVQPAVKQGYTVQGELLQTILMEMEGEHSLPLLQLIAHQNNVG